MTRNDETIIERALELWLSSYVPPLGVTMKGVCLDDSAGDVCSVLFLVGVGTQQSQSQRKQTLLDQVQRDIQRMAFDVFVGRGVLIIPTVKVV